MRYFAVALLAASVVVLVVGVAWYIASSTRSPARNIIKQHNALKKQAAKALSRGDRAEANLLSKAADDLFQLTKDIR